MERAYSVLNLKDVHDDDDMFRVEGIASTPAPDRMKDIVNPMGARFKTPMPLLWQHRTDQPVGHVTFAKPTKSGIPFKAEMPRIKEAGTLKDRIDEAIQSLKYNLVGAVSIGFSPLDGDYELMDNGGIRFNSWDWLELSLVTIPANSEAVITAIKSADRQYLPALGHTDIDVLRKASPSGVADKVITNAIQLIPRTKR